MSAVLYANASGTVLRYLGNNREQSLYPTPPTGTAFTLTFDPNTNRTLADDLSVSTRPYTFNGTTLAKNGTPVTISTTDPNSRDGITQRLDDLQATIQAATTVNQLKSEVQTLRQIVRDIVRNGQPFPNE